MHRIIGIVGSLAVGLLMAAAGLFFDVATLTTAGIVLFGLAAVLWLFEWGRSKRETAQEIEESKRKRRRELIDQARRLAIIYTKGETGEDSFRSYLEATQTYAALRSHLNPKYLEKLNAPRTLYAQADGARYHPLVDWFLAELDRLEREWRL